jgi:hypothetical protein
MEEMIMFYAHLDPFEQYTFIRRVALNEMPSDMREFCNRTGWLPPELQQLIQNNIFHNLPFHYGFRITRSGRVANLFKMAEVFHTVNKLGYPIATVNPDGSPRSISACIHRLLAIAFLVPRDYTDIDNLQVNHIDGNKLNFHLSNLEWVTQQRNCKHAYETGLRSDNTPIVITNVESGVSSVVYSMAEAGRMFNVTAAAIHWQLNNKRVAGPYKGHYLKYSDGR